MTDMQVENIIVSFSLCPSLDLPTLAGVLPDVKYDPEEVPALILQFIKPRCIVTIFSTGNAVVTGPKSMDDVSVIVQMIVDRLTVVGIQIQGTPQVNVQNVTGSINLQRPLDLALLAKSLQNVEYDPKVFPGLVYRGNDPNTVILLFDSGKIVCNSASLNAVTVTIDELLEKLLSFGIRKEEDICQK